MQTFLPYPDFAKSARALDNKRLGKQRVECDQILRAISNPSYGWQNHPAVRMWRGHSNALCEYMNSIVIEWSIVRGFKNSYEVVEVEHLILPLWIGNEAFHASHRSNLLRKDPVHYAKFRWTEPSDLPYVWP